MEAEGGGRAAAGKRRGSARARPPAGAARFTASPPSLSGPRPARPLAPLTSHFAGSRPARFSSLVLFARRSPARCRRAAPVPRCPVPPAASRRCGTAGPPRCPRRPPRLCEERPKRGRSRGPLQECFVPSPEVMAGRAPALAAVLLEDR